MKSLKQALASARVLVAGDVILDRYWHGSTQRISPEAPVPVVHVTANDERPGGAANVALNIRSLGATVAVVGAVGQDKDGETLRASLADRGIVCHLLAQPGLQTIVKLRVLSQHQQLIRLDFEDALPRLDLGAVSRAYAAALAEADVVVLSDYAKGVLQDARGLIRLAIEAGKRVVVDPKSADFSRYAGATVITPNMKEFEAVVGQCDGETAIEQRGRELCRRHDLGAVLVTRGEHGVLLVPRDGAAVAMPARARDVFDVTGAGDTVCGVLAAAMSAGFDLVHATRLANTAAGIVVGKLGAASVTPEELEHAADESLPMAGFGVVGEAQLLRGVAAARSRGERIVMTNGCFDILHAGHVRYLGEARRQGDRLIVAVNDDASVRRLKGPSRPVNALDHRMEVLAALSAVDWVVPFAEDTPARLICEVRPDVLVKGGDYRPEQIAGGDCVRAYGGEVVIVDFIPGHSTSGIIEAARAARAVEG
ncbi:MAG: bifunctional D-glycero-beta-D-manno-heptose-7-phosphate kinase/D-glycero-beta-D-manno-heptose 1-phosphate adenylyltransferase HldE [Gammaproteobacteria bacterium]